MTTITAQDFDLGRITTLVDYHIANTEAMWLRMYCPLVRPHDETLELFTIDNKLQVSRDTINNLTPKVLGQYHNCYGQRGGDGGALDGFAKGALSVANLIPEEQVNVAADFLAMQLDRMMEHEVFPAVDRRFLGDYANVLVATLSGNEVLTWREILAYSAGAWWFLGFCGNLDKKTHEKLSEVLIDRAKRGTINDF